MIASFVFPSSREGMSVYLYICILIGKQEKIACICIHSVSQEYALFLFYIPSAMCATGCSLLGNSHVLAVCCPPKVLYTSLDHKPHRLFTATQDIKAGYPLLYKWEKWGPNIGCHLNRNSEPVSSSLSPTPPSLRTNGNGLCHFIFIRGPSGLYLLPLITVGQNKWAGRSPS